MKGDTTILQKLKVLEFYEPLYNNKLHISYKGIHYHKETQKEIETLSILTESK